jgi:hypothetical protein
MQFQIALTFPLWRLILSRGCYEIAKTIGPEMKFPKLPILIVSLIATAVCTPAYAAPEKTGSRSSDAAELRQEARPQPQRSASDVLAARRKTRCLSCRILM